MNNRSAIANARVIHVRGSHYQMGFQHGRQVYDLRAAVQKAVDARFAQLAEDGPDEAFRALVAETRQLLVETDPAIVDMVRGQADGFALPFETLLRYNLVAFLRDVLTTRNQLTADGCTAWAATGAATVEGAPILVKNRDYRLEHLPLQIIVRSEPVGGYRTTYVTSAGSPGVFVAGMNEAGLAIVDTHISSTDVGPGLPAYALAQQVLEGQDRVRGALAYLQTTPRLGRNTFLLADAEGDIAAFEIGHRHYAVREATSGVLANTNHFLSAAMEPFFVDTAPPPVRGNTFARYENLTGMLAERHGRIDATWAQQLMASHDGLASFCRHPIAGLETSTIATMIFLPRQRRLIFGHGRPCAAQSTTFSYKT